MSIISKIVKHIHPKHTSSEHRHIPKTAFALLLITLIFAGWFYIYELDNQYILPTPDPEFVSITEFGTTTNVTLIGDGQIDKDENASTSEDYLPTELKGFEPSPESAWASVYLYQMGLKQEDLKLDIRYVREWQQTGGLTKDLSQGMKGADVKLMQYLLFIFDPEFKMSYVTGYFGPSTKSALIRLQTKLLIKPTGVFSEDTRFFFDSIFFKELCPDADPKQDKSYENVSRRISVPPDYIPSDLIRIPHSIKTVGVMCLSREPTKRLEKMFQDAKSEGHELAVFSAYRSANTQRLLTAYYLKTMGQKGLAGIAESGHSEHQLGTTVDISGKSIKYAGPSAKFGDTPEGIWLQQNSYKYGFILSYPKGKQADTGYIYEPWHFRYVGIDTAKDIYDEGLTIQEYLNLVNGLDEGLQNENDTGDNI